MKNEELIEYLDEKFNDLYEMIELSAVSNIINHVEKNIEEICEPKESLVKNKKQKKIQNQCTVLMQGILEDKQISKMNKWLRENQLQLAEVNKIREREVYIYLQSQYNLKKRILKLFINPFVMNLMK